MFQYEIEADQNGYRCVAGVDEAGRGPLAGPVVASAVALSEASGLEGLTDSKKLSQREREKFSLFPSSREYSKLFGLNKDKLKLLSPNLIVMHPGPINRGVELASNVADGQNSVILEQVTNGLAVRMAVLFLVTGGTTLHPEHLSS